MPDTQHFYTETFLDDTREKIDKAAANKGCTLNFEIDEGPKKVTFKPAEDGGYGYVPWESGMGTLMEKLSHYDEGAGIAIHCESSKERRKLIDGKVKLLY